MLGITLVGLAFRLAKLGETLYADEVSTFYIVNRRGLSDVLSLVSSDAEISPPLFFILAWIAGKVGSAPELIRLPSLLAGTLSIPLTYLVGARSVNRTTGLAAAAFVSLSPFMIYFSTEARGYAVAIALLLGSTLALLAAVETGGRGRWAAYAVCSSLAMYTHYTAAFPLLVQLLWVLWARPACRKPAVVANLIAVGLYLPWVHGLLSDNASPTVDILEVLVGTGLDAKRLALETWAFGEPYQAPGQFPGDTVVAVGAAAILVACLAAAFAVFRRRPVSYPWTDERAKYGAVLLILLGLSSPVFEFILAQFGGPNLFGARNLGTASAGFALGLAAVLFVARPVWRVAAGAALLVVLSIGAFGMVSTSTTKPDYKAVAAAIDEQATDDDIVLEVFDFNSTPVPITPLDIYRTGDEQTFRPGMPVGPPPFLGDVSAPPPPDGVIRDAFDEARNHRLYIVGVGGSFVSEGDQLTGILSGSEAGVVVETELPPDMATLRSEEFAGRLDLHLYVVQRQGS